MQCWAVWQCNVFCWTMKDAVEASRRWQWKRICGAASWRVEDAEFYFLFPLVTSLTSSSSSEWPETPLPTTLQCESKKNPPWGLVAIFPKRLGIFQPNFTCLLCIPICARVRICNKIPASYAIFSVTTQLQEAQLFAGIWPIVLPIADDLCKCCGAFI